MQKGVTLVELLIGLVIISIALSFTVPLWQTDSPKTILVKEQHRLYLFLRQIQARSENSSEVWLILANRNLATQQWCIGAQVKNDKLCDCLNPVNCPKDVYAQFYYPHFPEKTMINTSNLYPKEITKFYGARNTSVTRCFILQAENERTLFSFFNVGSIRLKTDSAASACNQS